MVTRVIQINDDGTFKAKGNNNIGSLEIEKNINKESIIGKVIFGGINFYLFYLLKYGIIVAISLLLTILIFHKKRKQK